MLKTYTEILGSELPIYTSKPNDDIYVFNDEKKKNCKYELIGYYLYDTENDFYKDLFILV